MTTLPLGEVLMRRQHVEDIDRYSFFNIGLFQFQSHPNTLIGCHSFVLACYSTFPIFQVSWWRYPGTTLLTQGSINFAEQDGYQLQVSNNSYLLTVSNAMLKHSGLYICQVALNEVELYRRNFSIYVEGVWKSCCPSL